jgi:hypothetical protein
MLRGNDTTLNGRYRKIDLSIRFWLFNGDNGVFVQLFSDNYDAQYCINTYAALNTVTLSIDQFTLAPT